MDAKQWLNKGVALGKLGRYEEAIKALEKALEIDPQDKEAWYNKGVALYELGKYKEAIKAFEKALEIDPQLKEAWNNKGVALGKLGRYEEAIKALEKALEIDPQDKEAWNNKGIALYNLGKYKEAIKTYEEAIEKKLQAPSFLYSGLGRVFFEIGDLENASQRVEEALTKDNDSISALYLKGRIKIEEKDYDSAMELFRKANSLDKGNPVFILWEVYANYLKIEFSSSTKDEKYLEEISAIIRNLERADTLSRKQKRKKEIRAYILYFLGCFYFKSGATFAAKEKLEECIKLRSKSSIEASARELLGNIWNYRIKPPWWRWWLNSPLYCWLKRIGFFVLFLLLLSIFGMLLLHPFMPMWLPSFRVNWTLYVFLVSLLIIALIFPNVKRIKTRDIEVELRTPPPFEPVLSPTVMEKSLKEMVGNIRAKK